MPSEATARQDAALAALRHLSARVRSIALLSTSPQACSPAPLPPLFLPALQQPEARITPLPSKLPSHCAHIVQLTSALLRQ